MIHTFLLNIGFVKQDDGTYYNNELNLSVEVLDDEHVLVPTDKGKVKTTVADLEEAIIGGGYGDF